MEYKFVELFKPKNWVRFLKKGLVYSLLLWFLAVVTRFTLSLFGIVFDLEALKSMTTLPGKVIIGLLVAATLGYVAIGFVVEFVENGDNKFLKWVQR